MEWYTLLAHLFAGVFLTNSIPHIVHGVSGRTFQSPFASPPGRGKSPAVVNVLWGFLNFMIGYLLLTGFGSFDLGLSFDSLVVGIGAVAMALRLAIHLTSLNTVSVG
jgi:hypothetical protein